MDTQVKRNVSATKKPSATNERSFRTFLLMEQFAAGEIGERIAEARRLANGMTQETLADLIGVSQRSIQDYEAGVTIPWKHLLGIGGATRKEVEWLLYGGEAREDLRSLVEEMVERVRRIEELLEDMPRSQQEVG